MFSYRLSRKHKNNDSIDSFSSDSLDKYSNGEIHQKRNLYPEIQLNHVGFSGATESVAVDFIQTIKQKLSEKKDSIKKCNYSPIEFDVARGQIISALNSKTAVDDETRTSIGLCASVRRNKDGELIRKMWYEYTHSSTTVILPLCHVQNDMLSIYMNNCTAESNETMDESVKACLQFVMYTPNPFTVDPGTESTGVRLPLFAEFIDISLTVLPDRSMADFVFNKSPYENKTGISNIVLTNTHTNTASSFNLNLYKYCPMQKTWDICM